MKVYYYIIALLLTLASAVVPVLAQEKGSEQLFDAKVLPKLAGGDWKYTVKTVSVNGKPFDHYAQIYGHPQEFITFDLRGGWDWFTGSLGVSDDKAKIAGTITFELDSKTAQTLIFQSGAAATPFKLALTGHQTLTIRRSAGMAYFLEPKLVRGIPPPPNTASNGPSISTTTSSATFVVDPE